MDTGISRTQLITKPSLDDLLYTFINGSADVAVDKAGQVKLGRAQEAQIADFNRDGALDIKIVYDSGYEVISG